MELRDSKIFLGILAISIGVSLILNEFFTIHDTFGLFVAIFFALLGFVMLFDKVHTHSISVLGYLILAFFGLSLLALEFNLMQWNSINAIFLLSISIGIAYLIYGSIIKYSTRDLITGIIFVAVGLIIFLPTTLGIEDVFWFNVKRFVIPLLLIVGGIFVLVPRRKQ